MKMVIFHSFLYVYQRVLWFNMVYSNDPPKDRKVGNIGKDGGKVSQKPSWFHTETASFWGLRPSQQAGKAGAQRSKLRL